MKLASLSVCLFAAIGLLNAGSVQAQLPSHQPLLDRFEATCKSPETVSLHPQPLIDTGWTRVESSDWLPFARQMEAISDVEPDHTRQIVSVDFYRSTVDGYALWLMVGVDREDRTLTHYTCAIHVADLNEANLHAAVDGWLGLVSEDGSDDASNALARCGVRENRWANVWPDNVTVSLSYYPGDEAMVPCLAAITGFANERVRNHFFGLSAFGPYATLTTMQSKRERSN